VKVAGRGTCPRIISEAQGPDRCPASPLACSRMIAVPLGPGTSRRCCRSAPASASDARSRDALASVPICARGRCCVLLLLG